MPDKKYIKKVYDFMQHAYGDKGAVASGKFAGSFDDFYKRISADEKYVQKIFGALSTAYGPKGVYRKDAFTPDITTFTGRVFTAPLKSDPANDPATVGASGPVDAVLQTATDIDLTEQTAGKYFQDIRAFEPDIKAAEDERSAATARAEDYLLSSRPAGAASMMTELTEPQKRGIVDDELQDYNKRYENSMRATLQRLDEEDKNRLSSQLVADELYETPQGKLYYDFVRPVYKAAVEITGKTLGFGARLFNADKTADKIVDYFDFDRLAREGNTSSALNMEPSKQKGKLGINNVLPRSMEALTNMGVLLSGTSAFGGGTMGLLGSSFATQYEGYRKTAKDAGLSDIEADKFAITSAGVTSALELISPNKLFLGNVKSELSKKTIFQAIKDGVSVKQAIKNAVKEGGGEIGREYLQELSQAIGDNAVKYAFDHYILNDPRFEQETILPSTQEALELAVLTSIATGVMSTPGLITKNKVPAIERSAWYAAAENPDVIEGGLSKAIANGLINEAEAQRIRADVAEYSSIVDALNAKGYGRDAVERMAINAYRAKKIDEQNKPIAGIPVLNSITAQDEAVKGDIEREIIAASSGQPESEYDTPEEIDIVEPFKTEQNVVQEQTVDESVLRQKGPELELQEMEQGDAGPERTAIEGEQSGQTEKGEITGFRTEKGSTYEIQGSTTVRNKAPRPDHPDDAGLKPSSERTVYLTKDDLDKLDLVQATNVEDGAKFVIAQLADGNIAVGVVGGKNHGKYVGRTIVTPKTEPAIGLFPLEIFNEGAGHHFGNKITEVYSAADTKGAASLSPKEQALNRLRAAWDAYKTTGIISDAEKNMQRDREFFGALSNYIKEEILFRANQVKNFAQQRKAKIKRAITSSLKNDGIRLQDISMFNNAFEEAYAQAKKIPGLLPDEANDRISFKEYIRDRIKVREAGRKKGVREGVKNAAERVKNTRKAISETLKGSGVKVTVQQLRRITTLLQRSVSARDTSKALNHAIDVTAQILWEQKNRQKIAHARGLIKAVSRLKRSKSMVLQDVEWLSQLPLPNPSKVDDIDTYIDMLNDFKRSRRADELTPRYTKEEIAEFVEQENARIYKEMRESQQQDLDALKEEGLIDDDVSLDEYIAILSNQAPLKLTEGISKKQAVLKRELKTKLNYLKNDLSRFTGEEVAVVSKLVDVEPSYLDGVDLIRLNNVLNNIAEFGTLDNAGDIVTTYEAKKANEELASAGEKIRELPAEAVLKKKNLSNIMSALFYNDNAIAAFRAKVIGPVEKALSPTFKKAQKVVHDFVELNRRHKIDAAANARLHAFSYLNQYRGIENGEIADDLAARLDDLIDDAQYFLEESNRVKPRKSGPLLDNALARLNALKAFGLIDYTIDETKAGKETKRKVSAKIKDVFDSANPTATLDAAWERLTVGEKAVYNFVRNHYDSLTDKLDFVTRVYAGKEFIRERNYVSLVARKKTGTPFKDDELTGDTDITHDLKSVNSKPSATTVRRVEKKPEGVYYDGDFFSNFVNRYYQSLYSAEVLPGLQVVAKTVNSKDFEKYITGQLDKGFRGNGGKNYERFKNKLIQAVNEGKYSPFFKGESKGVLDNAATKVLTSGIRLALNNIWQGPAQLAPAVIHNIAIADAKATGYALGTAFKAMASKQYAEDRAAFLQNFTGVKRTALGSDAYGNYINRLEDEPGWWTDVKRLSGKIHKLSAVSLERGDRYAQNTAYISGYITSLLKQGKIKSIGDFDFAEQAANPDPHALAYAEQIASAINNESSREYKPDVLKDSDKAKYLWLLQGFSLNAYQNAINKARVMFDNRRTTQERDEALLHFLGYAGEMATYQLVKHGARGFQTAIAAAILSVLFGIKAPDEEDKEATAKKDRIRSGANAIADISLSGQNALVQGVVKNWINQGYKDWAKVQVRDKRKEAREKGEKFDPRGTYLSPYFVPYYGVEGAGGGAEFYSAALKKAFDGMSEGTGWTTDPDQESKKNPEQKRIEALGKKINITMTAAAILLQSGDLMILNNRMQQQIHAAAKDTGKSSETAQSTTRRSQRRTTRKTDSR